MIATGTWRFFLLLAFGIRKDTASSFISEWNREDIEHHLSLLNLYETHNRTFHMTPPKPPIYLRRLYRKLDKGEQKDLPSQMRCYLGHGKILWQMGVVTRLHCLVSFRFAPIRAFRGPRYILVQYNSGRKGSSQCHTECWATAEVPGFRGGQSRRDRKQSRGTDSLR